MKYSEMKHFYFLLSILISTTLLQIYAQSDDNNNDKNFEGIPVKVTTSRIYSLTEDVDSKVTNIISINQNLNTIMITKKTSPNMSSRD